MSVKGFHEFLGERRLLRTSPPRSLQQQQQQGQQQGQQQQGASSSTASSPASTPRQGVRAPAPAWQFAGAALGSWPWVAGAAARDLACLVSAGARPVVVLPGLEVPAAASAAAQLRRLAGATQGAASAARAWEALGAGEADEGRQQLQAYCYHAWSCAGAGGAAGAAGASAPSSPSGGAPGAPWPAGCTLAGVRELQEALAGAARSCGVACVRAPRLAVAQAAAMGQQHGAPVLSGAEAAMFGAGRVVVALDAERGVFEWVDAVALVRDYNISHEQLLDACVLAGTDVTELIPVMPPRQSFRWALSSIRQSRSGRGVLSSLSNEPHTQKVTAGHYSSFMRSVALIKHHPVFTLGGCCEPLQKETSPDDLGEVVGPMLPHELMFLLFAGVVSPRVPNYLVTGALYDGVPVADTEEYRGLVAELLGLRGKTLGTLTSALCKQLQGVSVTYTSWCSEEPAPLAHSPDDVPPDMRVMGEADIDAELAAVSRAEVDLAFVLQAQARKVAAADARAAQQQGQQQQQQVFIDYVAPHARIEPITHIKPALVYTLTQGLVMMDHISGEDGRLTAVGTVLAEALGKRHVESAEQLLVALELLHAGYLSAEPLKALHAPSNAYDSAVPREVRLLSRVFSLLPMRFKGVAWSGPIDFDLTAFHCIVGAFCDTLRDLFEMLLVSFVLRRRISLALTDYATISSKLPFGLERNTGLGLAVRELCMIHASSSEGGQVQEKLAAAFGESPADLLGDLGRGIRFWFGVLTMAQVLCGHGLVESTVATDFVQANALLASVCASVPTLAEAYEHARVSH
eukprot:m51a1_g7781 hypothetical protein (801) ;mRNA; r:223940-226813